MWGVLRAKAVSAETIEFDMSEGYYDRASGARKDVSGGKATGDYFDKEKSFGIPTARLKALRQQHAIDEVVRP
jgi:hypothetical protein